MLVLSRKRDEQIILRHPGLEDIKITVVRIDSHNKVRLGIEADRAVTVLRSELTEQVEGQEKSAYSKAL
tara:strand:- start:1227 stop:1433 length:207 start_codon:yes stop_codon:yes gene_type:complete